MVCWLVSAVIVDRIGIRVRWEGGACAAGVGAGGSGRRSGGQVSFGAKFEVHFLRGEFPGSKVRLGPVFSGGKVSFAGARFSGSQVSFDGARFSGGEVSFDRAEFSGGEVDFDDSKFSGSQVTFVDAELWSHPPVFGWDGEPPAGVVLPDRRGVLALQ